MIRPRYGVWLAFVLLFIGALVLRLPFYGTGALIVGMMLIIVEIRR